MTIRYLPVEYAPSRAQHEAWCAGCGETPYLLTDEASQRFDLEPRDTVPHDCAAPMVPGGIIYECWTCRTLFWEELPGSGYRPGLTEPTHSGARCPDCEDAR